MLATITNNPDIACILAAVGLILGIVVLVQTHLGSIIAWAVIAVSLAGVLFWWPA
jgi:hypothetical protein